MKYDLIAISGVAQSGKDTLFKYLSFLLGDKYDCVRVALADKLKEDLNQFLISKFGISAFTTDKKEKEFIRPILIEYAKMHRSKSKGTYFTGLINTTVDELILNRKLPVITDLRFAEYDNDEYQWVKSKNGFIIHITRLDDKGNEIPANGHEEKKNNPKLIGLADYAFRWQTILPESIEAYMSREGFKRELLERLQA